MDGFALKETEDGVPEELHGHEEDEQGDDKAGQILNASVPEWVLRVCLLGRETKTDQGHNGGGGVREVVESIRGYGDRAGCKPRQGFGQGQ